MALRRAFQLGLRAPTVAAATAAPRAGLRAGVRGPARRYASQGHEPVNYTKTPENHGPGRWYEIAGTGMGAIMWFWILWRAKHDLPHLLGFSHPWDHGHGDEHHHEAAH